jgi:FKBP-type peptidyl-prolyl cis-trans isomerase FkpA
MKQLCKILFISILAISVSGCKKKTNCDAPTTTAPANEVTTLANYISSNSISAVKDDRGFYYNIQSAGGDKPDACSTVRVNYSGALTNGSVFDSANDVSFPLANLIVGWQQGIPLVGKGGKIILYLPPSLGYGSNAQSGIPANSILIFTIELLSF